MQARDNTRGAHWRWPHWTPSRSTSASTGKADSRT
jgi:hypothetical protein